MRFYQHTSQILFSTRSLSIVIAFVILMVLQPTLLAETLPTPSLTTPEDIHVWDFWDYVLFCTIFGFIVLLLLTFAKKHNEIDL